MKESRDVSVFSRLLRYEQFTVIASRVVGIAFLLLYVALISEVPRSSATTPQELGTMTLRVVIIALVSLISVYAVRELNRLSRPGLERRKTTRYREVRRSLYLLMALLVAVAVLYNVLLFY